MKTDGKGHDILVGFYNNTVDRKKDPVNPRAIT